MKPFGNKIRLDIPSVSVGAVKTDSIAERGVIVDIGVAGERHGIKVGNVLYFKAWGVDIITHGAEKYYFIDADSSAICGYEE